MGEIYINLLKVSDLKTPTTPLTWLEKMGITYNTSIRIERAEEITTRAYPHIGCDRNQGN